MTGKWRIWRSRMNGRWFASGLGSDGYFAGAYCDSWAEAYAYAYEQARLAASEVP